MTILAGFSGWNNREIMELIEGSGGTIRYLGYLDDQTLAQLYAAATLFLYPALYEGFGIPPLEAMACGTPVLVSRAASLPEVCADAAHYIDPYSVDAMREGIRQLLESTALRRELTERGLRRVAAFDWDLSAARHAEIFLELGREIGG